MGAGAGAPELAQVRLRLPHLLRGWTALFTGRFHAMPAAICGSVLALPPGGIPRTGV